jgi:hypothetical protein
MHKTAKKQKTTRSIASVLLSCVLLYAGSYTSVTHAENQSLSSFTIPAGMLEEYRLRIEGKITQAVAKRFVEHLKNYDTQPAKIPLVVELHSLGGDTRAAIEMGKAIHQRGGNTTVYQQCASACVYIFLAGKTRTAPDQSIGVHRPKVTRKIPGTSIEIEIFPEISKGAREFESKTRAELATYLQELQLSENTIQRIMGAENDAIQWLSTTEALSANITAQ